MSCLCVIFCFVTFQKKRLHVFYDDGMYICLGRCGIIKPVGSVLLDVLWESGVNTVEPLNDYEGFTERCQRFIGFQLRSMIVSSFREKKIFIHVFKFHVEDIITSIFVLIISFKSCVIEVDSLRLQPKNCPYSLKYPLNGSSFIHYCPKHALLAFASDSGQQIFQLS